MRHAALAALCSLLLAACATASGETRADLGERLSTNGYVEELYVSAPEAEAVEPQFLSQLNETLKAELQECARGETPLRVDVAVSAIERPNPIKSAIMTDTNEIRSQVKIYNLNTAELVGDYTIVRSTRGGLGVGGALMMMAMSDSQMRQGLANEICIRAFGADPGVLRRQVGTDTAEQPGG